MKSSKIALKPYLEAIFGFCDTLSGKELTAVNETKGRPAVLLLETIYRLEGLEGVSRLARKWGNSQPQGYLFWLNVLKQKGDLPRIIEVVPKA